jgi:hypothetical protein
MQAMIMRTPVCSDRADHVHLTLVALTFSCVPTGNSSSLLV